MPTSCRAILAAAGSRKTQEVVDSALSIEGSRVLIATYTNENQQEIARRIQQARGTVPPNVEIEGWFSFLIAQCAKPFQRAITSDPLVIKGLNFKGRRAKFAKKSELRYFLDANSDLYRDAVADFVVALNHLTRGAVIERLERIYSHVLIDEVQDLVGYDLDVLDLLLGSRIQLTLVGDPRQHTLRTNLGPRNKKYQGAGLARWLAERPGRVAIETRAESYRCNQSICDFADSIYPGLPKTTSVDVPESGHDGVFEIQKRDAREYFDRFRPVTVLRHDKNVDTAGLPAINIGVAKGRTFDRVMLFPTKPMLQFLHERDPTKLRAPERLYVAITRARYSVAIVNSD